ncbi:MAG: glycerol-3-phosphate responsive antiterminator [bacterium]
MRNDNELKLAINSSVIAIFVLYANIFSLAEIMEKAREKDKLLFVHIDLLEGIGKDKMGLRYLAENDLCDGIVTTKSNLIKTAKKEGLMTIQRLFLLDSASLRSGANILNDNQADAVEILPGIAAPYFIEHIECSLECPVIAGGLITERNEVEEVIAKGVLAVSSSNKELWNW